MRGWVRALMERMRRHATAPSGSVDARHQSAAAGASPPVPGTAAFTHPQQEWSIGIFQGPTPVDLKPALGAVNPVLTKTDITDTAAEFVADPFLARSADGWTMFFEVFDLKDGRGKIGLATSKDALAWRYQRIVLDEPFHLSYPYVFAYEGQHYLVPESGRANSVRLYRAAPFPQRWEFLCPLLEGPRFVDSSLFQWRQHWWLFTETNTTKRHSTLRLFHAAALTGPWIEHKRSPIVDGDAHIARPAGRVIVWQGRPIRFTQDCDPIYGTAVRAFAITKLTADKYEERPLRPGALLQASSAHWSSGGMHHIDAHQLPGRGWLAAVDGWREVRQSA